jgi:hypothetical protein
MVNVLNMLHQLNSIKLNADVTLEVHFSWSFVVRQWGCSVSKKNYPHFSMHWRWFICHCFHQVFSVCTFHSASPFVAKCPDAISFWKIPFCPQYDLNWSLKKLLHYMTPWHMEIHGVQHILISAHFNLRQQLLRRNGPEMVWHSWFVYSPSFPWAHPTDVLAPSQDWSLPQRMIGKFLTFAQCPCWFLSSRHIGIQVVSSL